MNSSHSRYNPDLYQEYDKLGIMHRNLKIPGEDTDIGYDDHIALLKTVIRCQKFLRKENVVMSKTNLSNNDSMLHSENYTGLENKGIDKKYRYIQEKPQGINQWHGTPVKSFQFLKSVAGYHSFNKCFEQDEKDEKAQEKVQEENSISKKDAESMSASLLHISMKSMALAKDDQHEECERYKQIFRFAYLFKGNEGPGKETRKST